jgi:hypothetical protein
LSFDFMIVTKAWRRTLVALVSVWTVGLAAQQQPPAPPGLQPPPGLKAGNPTPGTPQPEPPNLARRITLTGCVQATGNRSGRGAAGTDANSPSDSRFVLTNAERRNVVPAGTGTAGAAVEPADGSADRSADREYRLRAIDSQLSPFVGARVEISGEVLPSASKSGEDSANAPTLQVEFVQKLAAQCRD